MTKHFSKLGISQELLDILEENRIKEPTPIQRQAIPLILQGKDVIAQAQTGTGKTLAFLLPMMEKIDKNNPSIQSLVITPTRELAIQITAEAKKLKEGKDINILAAYGGQDVMKQVNKLKGNIHMVIGTPGRLLDHLRRGTIRLNRLSLLVLDEADQMLHMGFLQDVEAIIGQASKNRQTMSFSATMPKGVRALAAKYMKKPMEIQIESNNITVDEIKQVVVETTDRGKFDALCKTIDEQKPFMALIFCRTKRRVSKLNKDLQVAGYNSDELHGDLSQAKRERAMKAFKNLKTQFLVATDVAARGIDVDGLTHVYNYDIPEDAESYIHRIGRTGRAGETGVAVTFATVRDRHNLQMIEKGIEAKLDKDNSGDEEKGDRRKRSRHQGHKKQDRPRGKDAKDNRTSRGKYSDAKNNKGTKGKSSKKYGKVRNKRK